MITDEDRKRYQMERMMGMQNAAPLMMPRTEREARRYKLARAVEPPPKPVTAWVFATLAVVILAIAVALGVVRWVRSTSEPAPPASVR